MTAMKIDIRPSALSQRFRAWWSHTKVSEVIDPEISSPEQTAVSPEHPLELLEPITAVPETITINSLDAVHEQLFNIFYDADARRMIIADDPILIELALPHRWPNMECCIAGQDVNDMFCARADICISHIDLLEMGEASDIIHILLVPKSMANQVIETNKNFSRQLILIRY